jgi:hypothetical protein
LPKTFGISDGRQREGPDTHNQSNREDNQIAAFDSIWAITPQDFNLYFARHAKKCKIVMRKILAHNMIHGGAYMALGLSQIANPSLPAFAGWQRWRLLELHPQLAQSMTRQRKT